MIRAVTVDLWGTLLLDSAASDERYKRQRLAGMEGVLAAAGVRAARRDLERAYEDSGTRLARIWQTGRDVPVSHHLAAILEALDPGMPERLGPGVMADLVDAYSSPTLVVPPAVDGGARAALEVLAGRGITLGVVSNTMRTPGQVLRKILDRYGLLASFQVLTFSDECGIRKPDPEIFLLTLRQVGVAPKEAVHVGDDPVLDVQGGRNAGMWVIQLAEDGRATGVLRPDTVIRRFSELPTALDGLRP